MAMKRFGWQIIFRLYILALLEPPIGNRKLDLDANLTSGNVQRIEKMNEIQQILDKIKAMLFDMGFVEKIVTNPYRSETNYVSGNLYYIPQYVEQLGFLIEYADSYEEAKNHGHEDGDSFPLEIGEKSILNGLRKEIRQNINK